jgi:hypothetical protein
MFDSMFWLRFGFCFGLSVSYCFKNVSRGSKTLQDRQLGFTRGTRIMYKKQHFVFHLFSMQSIIYLHNLTFIHLIRPLSKRDHRTPEPSSKPPQTQSSSIFPPPKHHREPPPLGNRTPSASIHSVVNASKDCVL